MFPKWNGHILTTPSTSYCVSTQCHPLSMAFSLSWARDFHEEAKEILLAQDPAFRSCHSQLWQDHAPKDREDSKPFLAADSKLHQLSEEARQAAWQRDKIQFAKDIANIGCLYKLEAKSERAAKTSKILHCRAQNAIGASLVENYMSEWCQFHSGKQVDIDVRVDKVRGFKELWCLRI